MDAVPDLRGLDDRDVAVERDRLASGEPWGVTEVAGLQFYAYGKWDDVLGTTVIPAVGDRLAIVREPANPHDPQACQVWWRNSFMLGHLPRGLAAEIAPLLDDGTALRAYVYDPGDGDAWELRAILVGPAAELIYARFIERLVYKAVHGIPSADAKADERRKRRGARNAAALKVRRIRRLRQAADTFLTLPFEPELPAVGTRTDLDTLANALGCSDSTAGRIVRSTGEPCGRYTFSVPMTAEIDAACRRWAQAPKSRLSEYQQGRLASGVGELSGRSFKTLDTWGDCHVR